jgi:SPP1 gp7 family putative phage head morphogenesis protein|nr:MAG TPA: minor capsid protein [Caudoviricetes sp.]
MKRSKVYWVRRTAALEAALHSIAESKADEIIRAYERSIDGINRDIRKVFSEFTAITALSKEEGQRLLNAADSDMLYQDLLKLLQDTDDPAIQADIMSRINAQAYGARITRLEAVKASAYIQLRRVANQAAKVQNTLYANTLQKSYYTNIYNIAKGMDYGINFSVLPQRAVNKVLHEEWKGSNYSKRVWIHNDRFINAVQETIETGLINGHSVSRMAEQLQEYVKDTAPGGIIESTTKLVQSETAHFMSQGQLQAYEEIGIARYRFVSAFSERVCGICGALDGSTFEVSDAVEGENYPPIHPRCRCITIIDGAMPRTRIARDPLTSKNYKVDGSITFGEWAHSLSPEQQKAFKYYKVA